jgi:hypothetical protein
MLSRRRLFGWIIGLSATAALLTRPARLDLGFPHFRGVGRVEVDYDASPDTWVTTWRWTDGRRNAALGFVTTACARLQDPTIYGHQMMCLREAARQAMQMSDDDLAKAFGTSFSVRHVST